MKVLICGVNWVGDTIMSMPAIRHYLDTHPEAECSLLLKPSVQPLWSMFSDSLPALSVESGVPGIIRTMKLVRAENFERAYILPRSVRSALIPFGASIPERVGFSRPWCSGLLTDQISWRQVEGQHQSREWFKVFSCDPDTSSSMHPQLTPPDEATREAEEALKDVPKPRVALLPGAARGPSKRWPVKHFSTLGQTLCNRHGFGVVVAGTSNEREAGATICSQVGPSSLNLTGQCSMACWAAVLQQVDLVVCNDSGGGHLAAAVGTPVVVMYGHTDPDTTRPLGDRVTVVQADEGRGRDIARNNAEAQSALASLPPDRILDVVVQALS